jgi:hypothetical protein
MQTVQSNQLIASPSCCAVEVLTSIFKGRLPLRDFLIHIEPVSA